MLSQDEVRAAGGGHLIDRLAAARTPEEISEIILAIKELMARKKLAEPPPAKQQGEERADDR